MEGQSEIPGFVFRRRDQSHEIQALCVYASRHRIPWRFVSSVVEAPAGFIPVGSVAWVESFLHAKVRPEYCPDFLAAWLLRSVWKQASRPRNYPVFVKPADAYKRFPGFVATGGNGPRPKGPFWCSEVVGFTNEWRYYVASGKVLAAYWYAGNPVETPAAPDLNIDWPHGWCGAVDFGRLADGRIALVESHAPFACGFYGNLGEGETFARWIVAGWQFLNFGPGLKVKQA